MRSIDIRLSTCWQPNGRNCDPPRVEEAAGFRAVQLCRRHFHPLRQIMDSIDKGTRLPPETRRVGGDFRRAMRSCQLGSAKRHMPVKVILIHGRVRMNEAFHVTWYHTEGYP